MAGLPRKYAKMGFKRGWQAFRASTRSTPARRVVVKQVARKRRVRAFARSAFRKAKGRYSRGGVKLLQPSAMVYGAGRGYALGAAAPLLSKIPVPMGLQSEVGGAVLSWSLAKFGGGFIRDVGMAGLTVENYNVGRKLAAGGVGGLTGTASGSNAETNGWI